MLKFLNRENQIILFVVSNHIYLPCLPEGGRLRRRLDHDCLEHGRHCQPRRKQCHGPGGGQGQVESSRSEDQAGGGTHHGSCQRLQENCLEICANKVWILSGKIQRLLNKIQKSNQIRDKYRYLKYKPCQPGSWRQEDSPCSRSQGTIPAQLLLLALSPCPSPLAEASGEYLQGQWQGQ